MGLIYISILNLIVGGVTKASIVSGVTKASIVGGVTKASIVGGVTKASIVGGVTKCCAKDNTQHRAIQCIAG